MTTKQRTVAILCVFLVLFGFFKLRETVNQYRYIPEGLGANQILFAAEDSWGFGPGGNETGIIVYELPEGVAEKIRHGGADYLAKLPPRSESSQDWHGRFERWQSTPITLDRAWFDENSTVPKIANYLNQYGFGLPIESRIERDIDNAISRQGSFFAYGRMGMLIVIPESHKVVFAYAG